MKNIIRILFAINITLMSNTYSNSDAEQIEEADNLYSGLLEITHNSPEGILQQYIFEGFYAYTDLLLVTYEYNDMMSNVKKDPRHIKKLEESANTNIDNPKFCEILKNKIQNKFNQFPQSIKNTAQLYFLNMIISTENPDRKTLFKKRNCQEFLDYMLLKTVTLEDCKELFKRNKKTEEE